MTKPLESPHPSCVLCLFPRWFSKAFFIWPPNPPTKAQVKLPFFVAGNARLPRNCMCVVYQTIGSMVFIGDFPDFPRPPRPSDSR